MCIKKKTGAIYTFLSGLIHMQTKIDISKERVVTKAFLKFQKNISKSVFGEEWKIVFFISFNNATYDVLLLNYPFEKKFVKRWMLCAQTLGMFPPYFLASFASTSYTQHAWSRP